MSIISPTDCTQLHVLMWLSTDLKVACLRPEKAKEFTSEVYSKFMLPLKHVVIQSLFSISFLPVDWVRNFNSQLLQRDFETKSVLRNYPAYLCSVP